MYSSSMDACVWYSMQSFIHEIDILWREQPRRKINGYVVFKYLQTISWENVDIQIYLEYHNVCPIVRIGTPPSPSPPASVSSPQEPKAAMSSHRPNWDSPIPFPPSECVPPPRNKRGRETLTCGWGDGGVPIRTTEEKAKCSVNSVSHPPRFHSFYGQIFNDDVNVYSPNWLFSPSWYINIKIELFYVKNAFVARSIGISECCWSCKWC